MMHCWTAVTSVLGTTSGSSGTSMLGGGGISVLEGGGISVLGGGGISGLGSRRTSVLGGSGISGTSVLGSSRTSVLGGSGTSVLGRSAPSGGSRTSGSSRASPLSCRLVASASGWDVVTFAIGHVSLVGHLRLTGTSSRSSLPDNTGSDVDRGINTGMGIARRGGPGGRTIRPQGDIRRGCRRWHIRLRERSRLGAHFRAARGWPAPLVLVR